MNISVLIADGHAAIRTGLRFFLEAQESMTVVGEAEDGEQAVLRAEQLKPDVAVMEIALPRLNGLEATRRIRERSPNTQVVIFTVQDRIEYVFRSLQAGARAYVLKVSPDFDMVKAIHAVHEGHIYLCRYTSDMEVNKPLRSSGTVSFVVEVLSAQQQEALERMVQGQNTDETALAMGLPIEEVQMLRNSILRQLGLHTLPDLVRFALHEGLLRIGHSEQTTVITSQERAKLSPTDVGVLPEGELS